MKQTLLVWRKYTELFYLDLFFNIKKTHFDVVTGKLYIYIRADGQEI